MKTVQEEFKEVYFKQDARLSCVDRFDEAVQAFETSHHIKAPYKNYDSFRRVLKK